MMTAGGTTVLTGQTSPLYQWIIVLAVTLRFFMGGIDNSILPLGISQIAFDFGGQFASVLFLVDGIIFASALIFSGRLGDQIGLKPVFLTGVGSFILGSFLSSFASSIEMLIFFRLFSSIGLTLTLAVAIPIIMTYVPEEKRGVSIGYTIMGMSLGAVVGPTLCGFILETFGWHEMFLIQVPVGGIIFLLAFFGVPWTKCSTNRTIYDFPGLLLIFLTLGMFSLGMNLGLLDQNLLLFGETLLVTIIAGILFIWWEKRTISPLIDFSFVFRKTIIFPLIIVACIYCTYRISLYFFPIYLSEILRVSSFSAGIIMSIGAMIPVIGSPLSGHYMEKRGVPGMKRLLLLSGGFGILSSLSMISSPWLGSSLSVYCALFFLGIMFSLGYTAIYGYYYSCVPLEKVGMAGGIIETTGEFTALMAISFVQLFFATGVFISTGGTISARDIVVQAYSGVQALYLFVFMLSIVIILLTLKIPEKVMES